MLWQCWHPLYPLKTAAPCARWLREDAKANEEKARIDAAMNGSTFTWHSHWPVPPP
jgi:hypothetical protein